MGVNFEIQTMTNFDLKIGERSRFSVNSTTIFLMFPGKKYFSFCMFLHESSWTDHRHRPAPARCTDHYHVRRTTNTESRSDDSVA